MSFAQVNGVRLRYSLEGSGRGLPLVFLNSVGADLCIWDDLVEELSLPRTLVRYDQRGHGLSESPPAPCTLADHAEDLAGLLEYLELPKAILIGISLGGMVALDFASRHPAQVGGLILCDTGLKIGNAAFWQQRIALVEAQGLGGAAETILARWFTPRFIQSRPAEYAGYRSMLTRTPLAGYMASCAAIRDADLNGAAKQVQAKTLVLCGAEDLATPPDVARQLAGAINGARLEIIPQAGHFPTIEQPQATATKVQAFLKELGDGR